MMFPSEGWRCRWSPEWRQPALWRGVKLGCVMHVCGRAALIQWRATRGHRHGVRQAGVVAAAASKTLGPILGDRCERGVVHRPQAVLTAQRHREVILVSIHTVSKLESTTIFKILTVLCTIITPAAPGNENLWSKQPNGRLTAVQSLRGSDVVLALLKCPQWYLNLVAGLFCRKFTLNAWWIRKT